MVYSLLLGSHFGASLSSAASASTSQVPGLFPCAVAGRPYMVNTDPQAIGSIYHRFSRDSLPLLRTQADNARTSGESSVSPENLWRRSVDSWHHGAGQTHYDREDSDPYRFNASVGINPWSFGQISLLNSTALQKSATGSNGEMVVAGSYVFWIDGQSLKYSLLSGSTWGSSTTVTGTPAANATAIATNGRYIFVAFNSNGIYRVDVSSPGSATQIATVPGSAGCNGLWFNNGRLFASQTTGVLNEVTETSSSALATSYTVSQNYALMTFNDSTHMARYVPGWNWTASDALGAYHYFGGYYNDKSTIYKATLADTQNTKLGAPTVALQMPDGEYVTLLYAHLGYMFVGTSKGFRMADTDNSGNLILGPLIPTPAPVYCAEGQDRFVWFGWSNNTDSGFSGLGRADLTVFNKTLQPAYATDLMSSVTGTVSSILTTSDGKRTLMVVGSGIYAEDGVLSSGWITSGQITHGLTDQKVAVFQGVRHAALTTGQSVEIWHSVDGAAFNFLGSSNVVNSLQSPDFYVGERNTFIETKLIVKGPTVTGSLLRSYPAPKRLTRFMVPILLYDAITALNQRDYPLDVGYEYDFLVGLHTDQTIITYQEGDSSYSVIVDDFSWLPEKFSTKAKRYQGTLVLTLRQIA
jgi:hypothetical protein